MADGYPIRNQNEIHFITLNVVGWIDLFISPECRQIIIHNLDYCQKKKGLTIYAFVIMSNHIHLIVQAREGFLLSDILRDFKSYTAKKIILSIQNMKEKRKHWVDHTLRYFARYNKWNAEYQIWNQNNHPIELESPKFIIQKLFYIHNNPVKAAIVDNPEEYIYSSARNYAGKQGVLNVEIIDVGNDIGYISM